jgi:enoyl-CoA hydratase/carnithine racemase
MDDLSEKIYVDDQEGVRIITLNRPEKKNAFDQSMFPMLASILEAAQNDESIKVLQCLPIENSNK